MKRQLFSFDKSYIQTFANGINSSYANNAYNIMLNVIDDAMNSLCKNRPIVTDYNCQIVNECLTHSETQNSTLDIFMSIKSPQLELGIVKFSNNYFNKILNRFKLAWKDFREQKPKKRWWKRKSKDTQENDKKILETNLQKYTFQIFKRELMLELAKRFTDKTMLFVSNYGIVLLCGEEIGMDVNLYIVFSNGEEFTLFDELKLKLIDIEFKDRIKNIDKKNQSTNGNFVSALRIFNGLYKNIYFKPLNQILLESVLFNCPDELFFDEPYDMFIKLINFINASTMQNFKSITDEDKTINYENLINQSSMYDFVNFVKNLAKFV